MATEAVPSVAGEGSATLAPFPDGGNPPDAVIFDLDGTLTETELLKVPLSFPVIPSYHTSHRPSALRSFENCGKKTHLV